MSEILARWGSKSTKLSHPIQASLELTNRCNERCTHCYIDDFSDDKTRALDCEQWFHVLRQLRKGGVLYLILMGGEAMLSQHFWPVLRKASEMGFHVSMITNGLKIKNLEVAQELKDSGLSIATFSLYSQNSAVHDSMTRVKGSHERTLRAIDYCLEVGIEPTINCLMTKNNIDGVFKMYDWAEQKSLQLQVDYNVTPKLSGNLEPTKERASEQQLRWYFTEMMKRYPNTAPNPSGEKTTDFVCNAAKGKCAVTTYGDLLSCIEIRDKLGNLIQNDFHSIWHGEAAMKWRNVRVGHLKDVTNGGLELQNFCDHCPGLADHEHSDPLKMTEFTKLVGEIKRDLWKP